MPLYYFDVRAKSRVVDRVGTSLHNMTQARQEALRRAAEFASDIENLTEPGVIVVTARDEARDVVITVRLVCAVEPVSDALRASTS